jgi:Protein of unknown function (DUF3667)
VAPDGAEAAPREPKRTPYSLASLLDLDESELAEPLSRAAPPEHRWEQLTLGVASETGEATSAPLRTGAASQPPADGTELIPGMDAPGAVEVPVYLAGRALHDLMQGSTPAEIVTAGELAETTAESPSHDAADGWVMPASGQADGETTPLSTGTVTTPTRPLAIAQRASGRARRQQEAPAALFTKTEFGPLVWPSRRPAKTPRSVREECPKCGTLFLGMTCTACGFEVVVPARSRRSGLWHNLGTSFLESNSRIVRTIGALVFAPGEITDSYLGGQRQRYAGPFVLTVIALLVFAVASAMGSLRPRPDRSLAIGTDDRTTEYAAGLLHPVTVNLQVDAPPDLISNVATTMDYIPLLWFPLMAFCVVGAVSALRSFQRRDDYSEMLFGVEFSCWFVIIWAFIVPLALLAMKYGFELSAGWQGVTRVRYAMSGDVEGLSRQWNWLRNVSVTPTFHSLLLAAGVMPWATAAYHRVFDASWAQSVFAGLLVTAVPVLLLLPFR